MAEILWHRRETRRQTENTNFCLNGGKAPAYSPTTGENCDGNRLEGRLPASGDYKVRVYLMRSAARRDEIANQRLEMSID
jgi:hypothetical protein